MFSKSRFNNTFNDFRYKRKIRNRAIVRQLVLIEIRFDFVERTTFRATLLPFLATKMCFDIIAGVDAA